MAAAFTLGSFLYCTLAFLVSPGIIARKHWRKGKGVFKLQNSALCSWAYFAPNKHALMLELIHSIANNALIVVFIGSRNGKL